MEYNTRRYFDMFKIINALSVALPVLNGYSNNNDISIQKGIK